MAGKSPAALAAPGRSPLRGGRARHGPRGSNQDRWPPRAHQDAQAQRGHGRTAQHLHAEHGLRPH
eukprot:9394707-Lingulodinium_polyedra.AAC.1